LLNDADIVIHFNGTKFDIPILNREFVKQGMSPPAPYKQIDLLRLVRRAFRFESNKLAYVTQALGLQGKVKHEGFQLWVGCMNGDRKSWRTMERYNRNDVAILEPLYTRLLPWIGNHPNISALGEGLACPKCGSKKLQRRGVQVAKTQTYIRLQCQSCGGWARTNKALPSPKSEMAVNA
jgi:DNA-directed RNA polymerase subunit RPC12/RpoP